MRILLKTALITASILLIPLFGNRYVEGWNWHLFDFIVAGVLIFGAGLLFNLILSKVNNNTYRAILVAVLALVFFLVWADLAVGIFNIPGISGS
ncbi:hypothetical protein H6788_00240 [Candidatus Nomurabacteria bacterium]|nr:hypothetical protein [Candidatus Nomurabacteria bacterium]MCB9819225.1 hypothetical protein [Candidatus Nomurabacteria bacterium]